MTSEFSWLDPLFWTDLIEEEPMAIPGNKNLKTSHEAQCELSRAALLNFVSYGHYRSWIVSRIRRGEDCKFVIDQGMLKMESEVSR